VSIDNFEQYTNIMCVFLTVVHYSISELHISSEAEESQDLREEQPPRDKKDKKKDDAAGAGKLCAVTPSGAQCTKLYVFSAILAASTDDAAGENGEHKGATDTPAAEGEGAADVKMEVKEETGEGEHEVEEVKPHKEESPDVILDLKEGDTVEAEIENRVPRYKKTRSLGISQIGKLECFVCNICFKYFDSEATCEVHSRTHAHYRSFVKLLTEKSLETRVAQKRAAVAAEEDEKKRKLKEAAEAGGSTEGADGEDKKDGDLYDPSEATGDDTEMQNA
jgi:hypothetical protein